MVRLELSRDEARLLMTTYFYGKGRDANYRLTINDEAKTSLAEKMMEVARAVMEPK